MGAAGGTGIDLGNGSGFNPTSMMAGMAMGSAIGSNMAGMVNGMMGNLNQPVQNVMNTSISSVPPIPPTVQFNVAVNGQSTGPYDIQTLKNMAHSGQFNQESLVWKNGMANWQKAGTILELAEIFASNVPPVPPIPPVVPPAL